MKLIKPVARIIFAPAEPVNPERLSNEYGFSLKLSKNKSDLMRKLLIWTQGRGRPPLQHEYPYWDAPENDPHAPPDQWVQIWPGKMRIVRNSRRARLLRKRGVPLMDLQARNADGQGRGPRAWAWFVRDYVPAGTLVSLD